MPSMKRPASGSRKRAKKGRLKAEDEIEREEFSQEEVEGKVEVAQGAVERPLGKPGVVVQLAETPSKIMRHNVAKQSGVPGVNWINLKWAWHVVCPKLDDRGKITGKTCRSFSIRSFMKQGLTEDEAEAAALEAAKAFRAQLVAQGLVKEPKVKDPEFTSDVVGVSWYKAAQKWWVNLASKTKGGGAKKIYGGMFAEKAAAEAKALELAEAHGLQRSVRPVVRHEVHREVRPKVPQKGVKWERQSQRWHAFISLDGAQLDFRAKPNDFSEAELERSFQEAVAWRQRQEKERERLKKAEDEFMQEEITREEIEGKVEVAQGAVERPLGEPGAMPLADAPS